MKKVVKSRAFKDRLKGHKDAIISLHSNSFDSNMLYSASKDGCIRTWDLIERKIIIKLLVSKNSQENEDEEHIFSQKD